jgi:hypothetical protein
MQASWLGLWGCHGTWNIAKRKIEVVESPSLVHEQKSSMWPQSRNTAHMVELPIQGKHTMQGQSLVREKKGKSAACATAFSAAARGDENLYRFLACQRWPQQLETAAVDCTSRLLRRV